MLYFRVTITIRNIMKIFALLLLAIVSLGLYAWLQPSKIGVVDFAPKNTSYIDIYGRESCDYTRSVRKQLEAHDIHYRYFDLEQKSSTDRLHPFMHRSGMATDKYLLPVVDVNGKLQQRPSLDKVIEIYQGKKQVF